MMRVFDVETETRASFGRLRRDRRRRYIAVGRSMGLRFGNRNEV